MITITITGETLQDIIQQLVQAPVKVEEPTVKEQPVKEQPVEPVKKTKKKAEKVEEPVKEEAPAEPVKAEEPVKEETPAEPVKAEEPIAITSDPENIVAPASAADNSVSTASLKEELRAQGVNVDDNDALYLYARNKALEVKEKCGKPALALIVTHFHNSKRLAELTPDEYIPFVQECNERLAEEGK